MFDVASYLWLIPALPLAASALTALVAFGPAALKRYAHLPCILATALSCVLSVMVLASVYRSELEHAAVTSELAAPEHTAAAPAVVQQYVTWFDAGRVHVGFTLRADALTALMLVTVTFVGTFIVIFSAGYMKGDEGYPRYFAEVALFIFAMTGLVLADNFLLLYAFWEGVGLCSYLLIGFWFTKPAAAAAARKAFLVTRVGDAGLLLGILLLWAATGYNLDYDGVFKSAGTVNPAIITTACLLLFCGAAGKSAQFPLHVWLPDAMEGPTPVSALIHAATMVTAGVYLVARCTPLFVHAPFAQLTVASIGAFTALLAALIALTQNDLKRVLAYSTISQLGYMFLAVGAAAPAAGMFHLFTHAFFKALLFLAAGSVMHAMGNVIDLRKFGGLRRVLPITHATFLCGAAALAGVPFITSGFWSKDDILAGVWHASRHSDYPTVYGVLFWAALITAGLTAFYTFRAYFLTFWGEERIPHEAGHHAHESPPVMWVPLAVLAVGALVVGFLNAEPLTDALSHFLAAGTPHLVPAGVIETDTSTRTLLWLGSIVMAAAGIGGAWFVYLRQPGLAGRLAARMQVLYQLSANKFFLDEIYERLIVAPLAGFADFCRLVDAEVVDRLVDLVGQLPRLLGYLFRPVQNGLVQFYALAMVLGLAVFLLALARAL
jgi:proton-translocating NADH-quinone oxidoreductase chain L